MLQLGMIGLSPGNGHPYSWSAIFNGYDPQLMEQCGFPVIPRYLERQRFPDDAIQSARVTHVWAQSGQLANHIAKAARIPHIVEDWKALIGRVDAVLLARDDAETHPEFAAPFLDAGMPIYIDKPLALSVEDAEHMLRRQRYPGQLFSCSALRYAKEFQMDEQTRAEIGPVRHIHAVVPKDWDKYAVHVIEPALLLAPERGKIERFERWAAGSATTLQVLFSSGLCMQISTLGGSAAPLSLRVIGDHGWRDLFFADTFFAFKAALLEFVDGVAHRSVRIAPEFMLEVVEIVQAGRVG